MRKYPLLLSGGIHNLTISDPISEIRTVMPVSCQQSYYP